MKTSVLILLSLLSGFIASSQTLKILYSEQIILPEEIRKDLSQAKKEFYAEKYYTIIYSSNRSIYFPISELKDTTLIETREINGKTVPKKETKLKGVTKILVFKDYVSNLFRMELSYVGNDYSVKDQILPIDWKATNKAKAILGYNCKLATSVFYGKKIEAWFTDELPANLGPQIYGGLPGTILLMDYNGMKTYKAKKITTIKDKVNLDEPAAITALINFKEYRKQVYGE